MELKELKSHWDTFGKKDPLWAILTSPEKKDGKWKPEEFFQIGRDEIDKLFKSVEKLGYKKQRGKALDFGCGVGRLTQALSRHFSECHGVDIAPSMIDGANRFNRHGSRCKYHLNDKPDLSLFPSGTFDFIYTNIVLQHMEPRYSHGYIREFVRVLAPGGMLIFQIPGRRIDQSELRYRAQITIPRNRLTMRAGEYQTLVCRVKNTSDFTWPAVNLGNQWLDQNGDIYHQDDGRVCLPEGMQPGEARTVKLKVKAPDFVGEYLIRLDGVHEGLTWFAERGSATLDVPVRVVPQLPVVYQKLARFVARLGRTLTVPEQKQAVTQEASAERLSSVNCEAPEDAPVHEAVMEMYGTPKEEILDLLKSAGATVLQAEKNNAAGHEWESWRYYVTK